MRKHAFTLIELIFVIALMGVLTGIGFYMAQPDATKQDAQYTLLKLKEARYRAIGYDALDSAGCVTLTKEALSNASDNNDSMHREIKSENITFSQNLADGNTTCFDPLGRPHNGNNINLSSLLRINIDITFIDGDKNTTIHLFPQTGYAIIQCKN
jgi:prepilin-type N-terminal cleavage/methylation domain-containing protein